MTTGLPAGLCVLALLAASCAEALAPIDPADAGASVDARDGAMPVQRRAAGAVNAVAYDQHFSDGTALSITHYGASFARNFPVVDDVDCPGEPLDGCTLYHCDTNVPPMALEQVGAGAIDITGPVHTYNELPSTMNEYGEGLDPGERPWPAGSTLAVRAAGDPAGVPAFAAEIPLPDTLTLTTPLGLTSSRPIMIDARAALPFRWTGTTGAEVRVRVYGGSGNTLTMISCRALASAGAVDVPAAGIQMLLARGGTTSAVVEVWRQERAVALDGEWHVEVRASRQVVFGSVRGP